MNLKKIALSFLLIFFSGCQSTVSWWYEPLSETPRLSESKKIILAKVEDNRDTYNLGIHRNHFMVTKMYSRDQLDLIVKDAFTRDLEKAGFLVYQTKTGGADLSLDVYINQFYVENEHRAFLNWIDTTYYATVDLNLVTYIGGKRYFKRVRKTEDYTTFCITRSGCYEEVLQGAMKKVMQDVILSYVELVKNETNASN